MLGNERGNESQFARRSKLRYLPDYLIASDQSRLNRGDQHRQAHAISMSDVRSLSDNKALDCINQLGIMRFNYTGRNLITIT